MAEADPQREALVMARAFAEFVAQWHDERADLRGVRSLGTRARASIAAIDAALAAPGGDGWLSIETAPKDGSWFLLRGRNSAGAPMTPIVAAWRGGIGVTIGELCFRDSANLRDLTRLLADHPPSSKPDWRPLPTQDGGDG